MAEVLGKTTTTSMLSSSLPFKTCTGRRRFEPRRISMFSGKSVPVKIRTGSVLRSATDSEFFGGRVGFRGVNQSSRRRRNPDFQAGASDAKMSIAIGKSLRWWEKGLQSNMKEVTGAQDLVDSLLKAGDKLVVVDFFSPGCGGCRALHPKICQLAEMNPDVQFLQVNYEEHKSMCYSLNVHVLPFFRFYRGAHGRLCSFSCTNATIKKFKDALAKHNPDRCSLGPPKGLEEKELMALAANRDLSFTYEPKTEKQSAVPAEKETVKTPVPVSESTKSERNLPLALPLLRPLPLQSASDLNSLQDKGKTFVSSGR